MRHAITLHLLWVLNFRVYSNTPALDLFSKRARAAGGNSDCPSEEEATKPKRGPRGVYNVFARYTIPFGENKHYSCKQIIVTREKERQQRVRRCFAAYRVLQPIFGGDNRLITAPCDGLCRGLAEVEASPTRA